MLVSFPAVERVGFRRVEAILLDTLGTNLWRQRVPTPVGDYAAIPPRSPACWNAPARPANHWLALLVDGAARAWLVGRSAPL